MRNVDSPRSEQKWRLHPLIHTFSFKAPSTKYGSRLFKGKLRLNRRRECTKMLMGECFRASRMRSSASDKPPGAG